jgi:MoaA/NifB/PqqE/SkfB family radical SAM enzyme
MIQLHEINKLHVELSSKCQAACPLCSRNDYGFRTRSDFPITELTIDDWKQIFDNVHLPNVGHILFNGNFGDPLTATDFVKICEYSYEHWDKLKIIRVNTNGGLRSKIWWKELGTKFKNCGFTVSFAIDGIGDTNHIYRINVSYDKVIENARAFIDAGGHASWQMIKFRHNRHQYDQAKTLSEDYGFKNFELIDSGRNHGFVFTSKDNGYWILPDDDTFENYLTSPKIFRKIKPSVLDIKSFESEKSKWIENGRQLSCYTKQMKSVYLAANSELFPCCWTGQYPSQYKKWYNNFNKVVGNIENNTLDVGFEKAIDWFNKVEESWQEDKEIIRPCLGCAKN